MPQVNIGTEPYRIGASTNPYALQNNGTTDIYLGTGPNVTPERYDRLLDIGGELSWPADTDLYAVVTAGLTGQLTYLNNGASGNSGATRISGPVNISGDVEVSGPVTIAGTVPISGDVGINAPVAISGIVPITGDVTVSAPVAISGTVPISGDVGINAPVAISGTVPISGDVGITGPVSITGPVAIAGTIPVSIGDAIDIAGNVPIVGVPGSPISIAGNVGITGGVAIAGIVPISGNVGISGPVNIAGTVPVSGNMGISGPVTVNGGITVTSGNVNVAGNVSAQLKNTVTLINSQTVAFPAAALSSGGAYFSYDVSAYASILVTVEVQTAGSLNYAQANLIFGTFAFADATLASSTRANNTYEPTWTLCETQQNVYGLYLPQSLIVPVTGKYFSGIIEFSKAATATSGNIIVKIYGSNGTTIKPEYVCRGAGMLSGLDTYGMATFRGVGTDQYIPIGSKNGPAKYSQIAISGANSPQVFVSANIAGTYVNLAQSIINPANDDVILPMVPILLHGYCPPGTTADFSIVQ